MEKPRVSSSSRRLIRNGENVLMQCSSNQNNVILTWINENGRTVSDSSTFEIAHAQQSDTGRYRCKSTRENLFAFSNYIAINVICKFQIIFLVMTNLFCCFKMLKIMDNL